MRRRDLVRQIIALGAVFVREGGGHSIYQNPRTGQLIPVPRHVEIAEVLARKIIRDAAKNAG
ncbi:MAG TPA: type II toxin-antitoxin system HicA family toxin [Polyangiaceae bacterium]